MGGHHHHSHSTHISGRNLGLTIILNLLITASQFIGGVISGSLSLLSDALHNLTDVISLLISFIANRLTKKEQTVHQTFGYKRAEIIAAFLNSASLIVISLYLAYEAIHRFIKPEQVDSTIVIWLAGIALVANSLSVLLLQKDAKNNLNMKSAYLHLLTDALVSVVVLIGGLLMKYFQIYWVDPVLTLMISAYLLYLSWDILIESIQILMLFAPKEMDILAIVERVEKHDKIRNFHHVHVWQLNDHDTYIEGHIEFINDISLSEWDEVCQEVEQLLCDEFGIAHSMLQPEYCREDPKQVIIQD